MPGLSLFSSCELILVFLVSTIQPSKQRRKGRPFCECLALDILPSRVKESTLPVRHPELCRIASFGGKRDFLGLTGEWGGSC